MKTLNNSKIKGYKGFDKNLQCRDFQYKIGKTYKYKNEISLCKAGFYFYKNPIDVFNYYPPIEGNRYCKVTGQGKYKKNKNDSKIIIKKIKIEKELTLQELIKEGIEYISKKVKIKKRNSVISGNYSNSATSGYNSHSITSNINSNSATSGYNSHSITSGNNSNSATSGDNSYSVTSGNNSNSATSGKYSYSITSENDSHSTTSGISSDSITYGNNSHSLTAGNFSNSITHGKHSNSATSGISSDSITYRNNSHSTTFGISSDSITYGNNSHSLTAGNFSNSITHGKHSNSVTSGEYSDSEVNGKESIAIGIGKNNKAKGELGCWIVLSEWKENNNNWNLISVKSVKVDGEKIKPNTWYKLENGEFVEV